VTTVSREQSTAMHQLAEMIDGVEGVSDAATVQARDASDAATRQMRALEGLAETSRGLAQLAERLRVSTGRFAVSAPASESPTTGATPNDSATRERDVRGGVRAGVRGPSLTAA